MNTVVFKILVEKSSTNLYLSVYGTRLCNLIKMLFNFSVNLFIIFSFRIFIDNLFHFFEKFSEY